MDDDLSLAENLESARRITAQIKRSGKQKTIPLTVDFQEGYGDQLAEGIKKLIELGVVGINLEDALAQEGGTLRDPKEQVERIKLVRKVTTDEGVPDFYINARSDALIFGKSVDEAIERCNAYVAAGAQGCFVWGGSARGGVEKEESIRLIKEIKGKLNLSVNDTKLTVKEASEAGVARFSIGPALMMATYAGMEKLYGDHLSSLA